MAPPPHGATPGVHPLGVLSPFEPQAVDPASRARRHFGVVVFEGTFKLDVANHLSEIVHSQRHLLAPVAVGSGSKLRVLPQTPDYVKSIFHPFVRDLIEFAADRFGLKAPHRYHSDLQVTVTPPGGGSVPHADADEPGGRDRRLSWIYFIPSNERYQGGDLVLYDTRRASNLLTHLTRRVTVPPTPNTLVIFPSALVHEITPVVAAPRAEMTRPAIRGWLRWTE